MPATAPRTDFTVFVPFTKVSELPDGTLRVHLVINDEAVDDQGEILDYAGTKAALDDFMKWANLREMHQPSAIGIVESITHDDIAKVSEGIAHVVDPIAVLKVKTKVYKGSSLGGHKGPVMVLEKVGDQQVVRVKQPVIDEVSLVDHPSRPTAKLTLLKRSAEPEAEAAADEAAPDATAADASVQAPEAAAPEAPAAEVTEATEAAEAPADAVEKAAKPADLTKAAAAGTDTYLGPDGKPLAAAATAESAPAKAALAKSAVDDLWSLSDIINQLAAYIEAEALEGDTADVAKLKPILVELQAAAAAEAAEVGTPEDTAQREEEIAESMSSMPATEIVVVGGSPMYYAAVTGDLAKQAIALRKGALPAGETQRIQQLHDMAHAAGAECAATAVLSPAIVGDLGKVAGVDPDEFLAKVTKHFMEALGPTATPADLDAMKAEFLGVLGPIKEDLAKIAAQPVPGGPLRYAADDRRGVILTPGDPVGSSDLAAALAKASLAVTDPRIREELGRLAAAEEIAAARRAPSA